MLPLLTTVLAWLCVPQAGTHRSALMIPSTEHDFGVVRQGEPVARTFTVRNNAIEPLTITLAELSHPALKVHFTPKIAPASEAQIRLELDTTRLKGKIAAAALLRFDDLDKTSARFAITGTIQPAVEFLPFAAMFLSAFRGESPETVVEVVNHLDRPLHIRGVESTSSYFDAEVQTVEPGKLFRVRGRIKKDAPLGKIQEPLYLLTDDSNRPRLRILVNVIVKPDVYVVPDAVDFGRASIAELNRTPSLVTLLAQPLLLKTREQQIDLRTLETDLPFVSLKRIPEGAAQTHRIEAALVRERLRPGVISGSIILKTSDPRFPEFKIPVHGELTE